MEKSNPLPLAWMIHGDATKPNLKLPLLLPCSSSSSPSSFQNPLFSLLSFYSWLFVFQMGRNEENGLYKLCFY